MEKRCIGQVKFFDKTKGFGFINIIYTRKGDEEFIGKDIYIHQKNIKPESNIFGYLEKNEYVEFDIINDEKRNTIQAGVVTGINRGTLFCEANIKPNINYNNIRK